MSTERKEPPRTQLPERRQVEFRAYDLDSTLPEEHRARAVWEAVEQLDLSRFYDAIEARGSNPGRPAIDPKLLVALWVFATSEGVGSARELARLCERDDAYRWLVGGVSVNHHTLSDFRVGHGAALDDLMTQLLAVLTHNKILRLKRVAHDGMRVRASAGASSFRSRKTLEDHAAEADRQIAALKRELENEPSASTDRQNAARMRAARVRKKSIARALAELPSIEVTKDRNKRRDRDARRKQRRNEARASTTDADARVMKMGDGGYRPAYNVQLATDTESRIVVGVGVTNVGSDQGQLEPMLDEIERRTGGLPEEHLVDGGFVKKEAIEHAAARGTTVYAPVPTSRVDGVDPHAPKSDDSAAVAEWRQRMDNDDAKKIYRKRASTAETVNADLRCFRGLDRMVVRGLPKVRCVVIWAVLAYNILKITS